MFTKPLNEESLWKSEMHKAGHISLSIKNPPLDPLKKAKPCSRRFITFTEPVPKYSVNNLVSSYNEYSKKYWNEVKYRQAIYQFRRRAEAMPGYREVKL
jgi:hypothetical protein